MIFYQLEKELTKIRYNPKDASKKQKQEQKERLLAVFNREEWVSGMDTIGFEYDWDICYSAVNGTKAEYEPGYFLAVFCVPAVLEPAGKKQEIFCFINTDFLVIVDQNEIAAQILKTMEHNQNEKNRKIDGMELFLYHFICQLLFQGNSVLEDYEQQVIALEERIMLRPLESFHEQLMFLRKNLLELECYYDQMADVLREFKENENEYFAREKLRYFRTVSERAERMERKAAKLLEQSKQIRDVYQAQIEAKQNQIMQLLTVVSTIFAPLTLLTGWYGMNFHSMPELEWGYPGIFLVAAAIIAVLIVYFKRKHFL